jgi:hypothetical protein
LWESQLQTEELLVRALTPDGQRATDLRRRVLAASCLAAVTAALLVWVERDGRPDLLDLVERAFIALRTEVGRS